MVPSRQQHLDVACDTVVALSREPSSQPPAAKCIGNTLYSRFPSVEARPTRMQVMCIPDMRLRESHVALFRPAEGHCIPIREARRTYSHPSLPWQR